MILEVSKERLPTHSFKPTGALRCLCVVTVLPSLTSELIRAPTFASAYPSSVPYSLLPPHPRSLAFHQGNASSQFSIRVTEFELPPPSNDDLIPLVRVHTRYLAKRDAHGPELVKPRKEIQFDYQVGMFATLPFQFT